MEPSDPTFPADTAIGHSLASTGDRVDDAQAIAGEVRALALADAPILVQPLAPLPDGLGVRQPWIGRIENLDPVTGDFVLGPDRTSGRRIDATFRLACRQAVRLLGIYDGVHVEFELDGLGARYEDEVWRLTGRTPGHLYRLQRREAYRVDVVDAAVALRVYRLSRWTTLVVEDLSEGGLRVRIPAAQATPVQGARWSYCKLELPESDPIVCDLQVVHAAVPADGPDGRPVGARTAGLRFEQIESHDAFELRRWIVARQLEEAALRIDSNRLRGEPTPWLRSAAPTTT